MRCGITIVTGVTIDTTDITGIIGTGTGIITGTTGGGGIRIIATMDTIGAGIAITRMVTTGAGIIRVVTTTAISVDLRFLIEARRN